MRKTILIITVLSLPAMLSAQSISFKRGVSVANSQISEADLAIMEGKLSWYYNWGTAPEAQVEPLLTAYAIEYIPMAWNSYFDEAKMRTYYQNHPEAKYLLGFNEPNFIEQANMTPTEAAAAWPALEAIADEFDLTLVSPAVNWCGNCVSEGGTTFTNPYEYLDAFFEACTDCRVDHIAVHVYMCYAGAVADYLDGFKKYGKKIWLTEFNCWDQSNITVDMQKNLMIGALDHMDNDTMIYRYAWFIGRSQSSSSTYDIFDAEPGSLTDLGALYFNLDTRHDTSVFTEIPAKIEAESYSSMAGIQLELTQDFEGMANVGWFDAGDWLQYNIEIPQTQDYFLYLRLASTASTDIEIWIDDELYETIEISSTGGWQNWQTFVLQMPLEVGRSKLKLGSSTGSFNVNWIKITEDENRSPLTDAGEDITIPSDQNSVTLAAIL